MICELCGKRTDKILTAVIEGVKMQVCEECARFGKIVHEKIEEAHEKVDIEEFNEEELVEDWREKIRKKVLEENKAGKTIEEIAKSWRVKESLLRGIIRGDIEISIELAKKFEKLLGVSLVRKIKVENIRKTKKIKEEPMMTLGDIVKIRIRS